MGPRVAESAAQLRQDYVDLREQMDADVELSHQRAAKLTEMRAEIAQRRRQGRPVAELNYLLLARLTLCPLFLALRERGRREWIDRHFPFSLKMLYIEYIVCNRVAGINRRSAGEALGIAGLVIYLVVRN